MQLLFKTFAVGTCFVDQRLPLVIVCAFKQRQQARAEAMLQGVTGWAGIEEGVKRFVIPLEQALLWAGFEVRHVQFDDVLLANAVQTANTLFQQVWVGRQIEQYQMVGELEVTTFATDFRADKHLSPELFIREVGGCAVALQNVHAFVEDRGRNTGTHAQGVFQIHCCFGVGADHQYFGALEHFEGVGQPLNPRVKAPPAFFVTCVWLCLKADFGVQLGVFTQRQLQILVWAWQWVSMQFALREALDGGAGVTEQDAACAVTV